MTIIAVSGWLSGCATYGGHESHSKEEHARFMEQLRDPDTPPDRP